MITVYAYKKEPNKDENFYEYLGLSTDTKPQDKKVAVNSMFLELDTGDFYYLKSQATESEQTIVEEQTVQDSTYFDPWIENFKITEDEIKVKFDGVIYSCSCIHEEYDGYVCYIYGGYNTDPESEVSTDFSVYPFLIISFVYDDDIDNYIELDVKDENEHTIEIYTESSTPAVWEKIGIGGSSGGSSVVGEAVVGTAVVGTEPQPALQLIYETTITTWESDGDGAYIAYADNNPTISFPSVITVDYDGTMYKDILYTIQDDYWGYGAVWDISSYTWDFSDYPFVILYENIPDYGMSFSAHVSTNATHTFKVYVDADDNEPLAGGGNHR